MKVDEVEENGRKWRKMDENGCKCSESIQDSPKLAIFPTYARPERRRREG